MTSAVINKIVNEYFTVVDVNGNLIPNIDTTTFIAFIYNPDGVNVTNSVSYTFYELGDGNYKLIFIPDEVGTWYVNVVHLEYFPWGKNNDIFVYEADLSMIYETVIKTLGLSHHNVFIDEAEYDEFGNMISARVRTYSNSASVGTDDDIIETYRIESDGTECGRFTYWQQVQI